VVILIGFLVITVIELFPPWLDARDPTAPFPPMTYGGWIRGAGHHFVFSPPPHCQVDIDRLWSYTFAVAAITAGIVLLLGGRRGPRPAD
jgi:hypothetical protein